MTLTTTHVSLIVLSYDERVFNLLTHPHILPVEMIKIQGVTAPIVGTVTTSVENLYDLLCMVFLFQFFFLTLGN
jgi:hypothetical protein